jgi:uncharacterized protein
MPKDQSRKDRRPEDQSEVVAFLSDPGSYGGDVERVEIVETHASLVFLAGERACKLKRAVAYPYLDFSTVARRRAACRARPNSTSSCAPSCADATAGSASRPAAAPSTGSS